MSEQSAAERAYAELVTYLKRYYARDDDYRLGGPFEDGERAAFVATNDDGLYAELQGAGFLVAFPDIEEKTRFFILERDEPMYRSFVELVSEADDV